MDKQTLSHYGWIVVWILTISVIIVLATPFGKYVGVAVKNVAYSFNDTTKKNMDEIEKKEQENDIELNGSYIVTNKQGNDKCYVFEVNNKYDSYSLVENGVVPAIKDRYFRCTRYVDIEEQRKIKEMFFLARVLGLDDTLEDRQGLQCLLLHYVNGNDYSEYASSISPTTKDVYDTLLSQSGTLEPDDYDKIKLLAIEKNGYIDMIIVNPNGFNFGEKEYIITESVYKKLHLRLNKMIVFCIERDCVSPKVGDVYYQISELAYPERLEKVAVAINVLDDDSDDFRTACQYAVWQCYEENKNMVALAKGKSENVSAFVEQILNYVPDKEYNVSISFYYTENKQSVCHFDVSPVEES